MSVAAERSHSPTHFGHKRSFEPADSPEQQHPTSEQHNKRPRRHHRVSLSRGSHSEAQHAGAGRASTLLALKGLFPAMEEQVLSDILETCGDNIDAAIQRLGDLQLTANCSGTVVHDISHAAAAACPVPSKPPSKAERPAQNLNWPDGGAEVNGHAHVDSAEAAQAETEIKPKSSADWVELLVQQMAGAKDLNDARSRATQMLQAFEQAVLQQASQGLGKDEVHALRSHLNDLSRDNTILKRAVAIQNSRMQDAVHSKDAELAALRSALQQYEQKVKALELTNYSLSMHLRQATEANQSFHLGQQPPDVY